MLLNCGVGEDSWESLGLQGDQTCHSKRKSILNIHWKDWRWSWNSNTLATWCKDWLIGKDPDAGKDWRQEEKRTTVDEIVEWHHWLNGHEFEQALGVGDGQGSLACYSPWGCKESTYLSDSTELNCQTISRPNVLCIVKPCMPCSLSTWNAFSYLVCLVYSALSFKMKDGVQMTPTL